jgi:hypothetical protein
MIVLHPQRVLLRRHVRLLRRRASRVRSRLVRRGLARRRVRRWIVVGALAMVGGACVTGLGAAALARTAPSWWVTVRRDDPGTVATARTIENQIMTRVYQDRSGDNALWTVDIPAAEANAWLNVRLPMWVANQKDKFRWPKDMSDLQVNFSDDRVTIGAKVRSGQREQVFTATIEPRLTTDGRLYIPARWVSVGRLSIPADWVLDHAHRTAQQYIPANLRALPETDALFRAFMGEQAIRNSALINLSDGRAVRVVSFSARNDRLEITCKTERREQASR